VRPLGEFVAIGHAVRRSAGDGAILSAIGER
jgi:hypothetical protein